MSEYFQKKNLQVPTYMYFYHFTQITLKSSRSSNSLQKPHTEPILWSDCIPIVAFDNPEEDNCSNTIDASSARLDSATVQYTTQNDFLGIPVPLFIANIFCKNVKIPCAFYLPFSQRLRTFYCLYESHTPLCKLVCHASSHSKLFYC